MEQHDEHTNGQVTSLPCLLMLMTHGDFVPLDTLNYLFKLTISKGRTLTCLFALEAALDWRHDFFALLSVIVVRGQVWEFLFSDFMCFLWGSA